MSTALSQQIEDFNPVSPENWKLFIQSLSSIVREFARVGLFDDFDKDKRNQLEIKSKPTHFHIDIVPRFHSSDVSAFKTDLHEFVAEFQDREDREH